VQRSEPRRRCAGRLAAALVLGALVALLVAPTASAHGTAAVGPPDARSFVVDWTIEPAVAIPILVAALVWLWLATSVNAAHPTNRVPRARSVCFFGALAAIAIALMSGIDRYDTILFSVHMVQHILLTLVAAPLLALSAPITLLLRASTPAVRRRWILPALHSRVVRVVSFPVVAWVLFAAVMWGTHFSPIFDRALEDPFVHDLEHLAYLVAGVLFWWPAVGLDPSPWRMAHPVRVLYVFLQMPQNTFLAVAVLGAGAPLYQHYATLIRSWGPTPLADQQTAGGIMWLVGDLIFLGAILLLVAGWMRAEERKSAQFDRRADVAMAAIREREARLAERVSEQRAGGSERG
jgi:putative copper resistance protein D